LALETACLRGLDLLLLMTATATKSHITRKDGPRRMITSKPKQLLKVFSSPALKAIRSVAEDR
jgi:hypothetical protein